MAKKATENKVDEQALLKAHKVKKMWKNSKGEYFLTENLALLSEKHDKTKLEEIVLKDEVAKTPVIDPKDDQEDQGDDSKGQGGDPNSKTE